MLRLNHRLDGEIKIGGNYLPWVRHGDTLYLSGQIPRVGDTVMLPGRVGEDLGLAQAQDAARICALRALALMRQAVGSLDQISQVLRITVCVQCTAAFTQHSEVADGASAVLQEVLGDAGRPTRTSVGVFQLPKNAAVEMDLIAAVMDAPCQPS